MNNKYKYIPILLLGFNVVLVSSAYAAKEPSLWDDIVIEKFITKNPFKPQLPEKEESKKVIPKEFKPVKIEEPKGNLWDKFKNIQPPNFSKTTEPKQEVEIAVIPPQLIITGLIWNTDRPQAIVNGQIVDIGDTIEATKIVAIRKNAIDISFKGKTLTIRP